MYADDYLRPWYQALVESVPGYRPFDAHTHTGFNDPDGNHLQIDCRGYPFSEHVGVASFDPWDLQYSWRDWPARQ